MVFLRRLVAGGASRSYGIQVAQLAGLPEAVIARSREILRNLEAEELTPEGLPRLAGREAGQAGQLALGLGEGSAAPPSAAEQEVLATLRALDPDQTTPVDALLALRELTRRLEGPPGKPEPS